MTIFSKQWNVNHFGSINGFATAEPSPFGPTMEWLRTTDEVYL